MARGLKLRYGIGTSFPLRPDERPNSLPVVLAGFPPWIHITLHRMKGLQYVELCLRAEVPEKNIPKFDVVLDPKPHDDEEGVQVRIEYHLEDQLINFFDPRDGEEDSCYASLDVTVPEGVRVRFAGCKIVNCNM